MIKVYCIVVYCVPKLHIHLWGHQSISASTLSAMSFHYGCFLMPESQRFSAFAFWDISEPLPLYPSCYIFFKGTDRGLFCVFNRCVKFSYGPCCWQFGDIKATLAALHQDGSTSGIALHYCTFHCIAHHITSYYMPYIIVHFILPFVI